MIDAISFLNIPLIIVGVAIAVSTILGAVVFLDDRKSITNITFLFFSLSAVFWNIINYLFYQPNHSTGFALLLLRLVVFFAVWYCFFLSQLFYVFPEKKVSFPLKYSRFILPLTAVVSFITLTPLVFQKITSFSPDGRVATVLNGFGIYIFGATVVSIILSGFFILITKLLKREWGLMRVNIGGLSMVKKVNIAVIGCGYWGPNLARNLFWRL